MRHQGLYIQFSDHQHSIPNFHAPVHPCRPSIEHLELCWLRHQADVPSAERKLQLGGGPQQTSKPDFRPVPSSSMLDRVRSFLPAMQRANAELAQQAAQRPPEELDIEHVPEGGPHVEMDLACGILDLKNPAAVARAEAAMQAGPMQALAACSNDASSDDDSSDEDEGEELGLRPQGCAAADKSQLADMGMKDGLASSREARPPGTGPPKQSGAGIVMLGN